MRNLNKAFYDCKIYKISEELECKWLKGHLIHVPSGKKYNYGYILFLPENMQNNFTMIVEGSNVSTATDNIEEANQKILDEGLSPSLPIYDIANDLGLPVLFSLFPRVYNGTETIYNHMLSENSIINSTNELIEYGLERVDLQMLEMFNDAKKRLEESEYCVNDKFIIDGFSASAKFANRFTVLHPDNVCLCIAGGVSGVLTLPIKEFNGEKLFWPVGLANIEDTCNMKFDEEYLNKFSKVRQLYYMGENDNNNPFIFAENGNPKYSGMISAFSLKQIYSLFGDSMIKSRWHNSQKYYQQLNINSKFITYKDCGHDPRPAREDIKEEIKNVLNYKKIFIN